MLLACALGLAEGSALAVVVTPTSEPLPGSQFQGGDGNQDDTATLIDWQGLQADERVEHSADPNENDKIFTEGSKELTPGGWTLTTLNGGANPKSVNIRDWYGAIDQPLGGVVFLYLAFTREASNGTAFLTFELNQDKRIWKNAAGADIPCRRTGDVLISFEPQGNDAIVFAQRWVTREHDPATGCATSGDLESAPNIKPPPDVEANLQASFSQSTSTNYLPGFYTATIPAGDFGETAINISSVLAGLGEPCEVFASTWMHSQSSSSSETAALKDYVIPHPFAVRTCKTSPQLSSVASGPASRRARGAHRSRGHRAAGATYDTAHLSEGAEATGTITFKLYGPDEPTCAGEPAFVDTAEVIGDGYYRSGEFMPTAAGTYRWVIDYSGDGNNNAAGPTACGAEGETILVTPAPKPSHPQLSTSASLTGKIGARHPIRSAGLLIHDAATLGGGSAPTGEIAFYLYGPNNATCSGTPVLSTATEVHGNGIYNSQAFAPSAPGTYRWVARYSGDARNHPAGPTLCDDGAEQVHVTAPAEPQLTSSASQAVTIGGAIRDTSHLSGGFRPGGTITFRLYGPADRTCAGHVVFTSTVAVAGNNDYTSHSFTPTSPGGYRWIASYSGDSQNHRAGPTACGDPAELAIVRPSGITAVIPVFSTTASHPAGVGMPVYDIAHLSGGIAPGGAITFTLYGPKEPSCSRPPVFTAIAVVTGNGDYRSASFIAPRAGTYRWVVTYSGDARNSGAGPTRCGEGKETASVATRPGPNPNPGPNIAVLAAKTHHRARPLHRRKPPPPPVTG